MTSAFDLTGRVAMVTGASGGLGAGMAIGLAAAGADVVCAGVVSVEDTVAQVRALGRRAVAAYGDVSDRAVPARLFDDAEAALGPVDLLINNAGIIRRAPAAEHPDEDWDQVLAINLSSVFRLSREAGRRWLARGARGKIVNIASLLSFQGGILVPGYAAAKGGVAQLTKALANEWAGRGINVNAIAPGYMATDNTAPLRADATRSRQILERIPANRWGEPADVAGAAVFLCAPASDYVNGHVLVVDGGWLAR
jgi:2-deoxy-D-gluconate 3-dehydrogenase